MRGQPGPCLAPGNYPAARRFIRRRKPPPLILWTIGIITCLLFIGAIAMLTVGYLNPFGTVGLAILGVGAFVYFGAIIFLVLSCLWVERKYPGMQPLSFKMYSRKPNRMPPTTFTNPNISGQMPTDTTPSYRMHTELPIQIPGSKEMGGKRDTSQEKKDNKHPSHGSSPSNAENPTGQQTALEILQEDHNGVNSEDASTDIRLQTHKNNDNINEDTSSDTGIDLKSQSQLEQLKNKYGEDSAETLGMDQTKTAQHIQSEDNNNVSPSTKIERKVKFKTHHIEVPPEDYPSSDSSIVSNKKDKSQNTNSKNISQNISTTNENSTTSVSKSKSHSSTKAPAMDTKKETSVGEHNILHTNDAASHNTVEHSTTKDFKQATSNPSIFIEKDETCQNNPQSNSHLTGSSPAYTRKQIPGKHQNNQESPQRKRGLTPTNSASPPSVKKSENQQIKATISVQKDSALTPKSSPVSARKLLDVHRKNTNHLHESEKLQTSAFVKSGENILPHKTNFIHDRQNVATSPKHHTKKSGSPGGSPTHTQKMHSPDRTQKTRKDNTVTNSPTTNRKAEGSSSPQGHHQKRIDNIPKTDITKVQEKSITIQTFSSSGKKEVIQKKKISHSSPSSQSDDFPSTSSSSPSRQHQRSPNVSPRLQRNGDHTSRRAAFYSSPRKEDFSNKQGRHSSPTPQSSDVPSSPSSSPQRAHRSPDGFTKMQTHKSIPATSMLSSTNNKDELHKRISQATSQSSDVLSSSSSSPLSSKELLKIKKEQSNQNQQRTNK